MRDLRRVIIHPFLLALHPVLFVYVRNRSEFPASVLWAPLGVTLLGAALLWLALSGLVRAADRAALLVSLLVVWFFAFGPACDALLPLGGGLWGAVLGPGKVVFATSLPLLGWLGFLIVKRARRVTEINQILNVGALVLVLGPLVSWGLEQTHVVGGARPAIAPTADAPAPVRPSASAHLPDIYFIVLDTYTRHDVLSEYGADNSALLQHLRRRGFYVADRAHSNYSSTELSLSATLNLDYLQTLLGPLDPSSHDHITPRLLIINSQLFRLAHERGYRVVAFDSGYWNTTVDQADEFLSPRLIGADFRDSLLQQTPLPRVLGRFIVEQAAARRERIRFTLEHVPEVPRPGPGPMLVFAHLLAVHPPFVFGPHGEPLVTSRLRVDWQAGDQQARNQFEQMRQQYADQVRCVSAMTERMVDRLLDSATRPTVIIIQGDHGPNLRTVPGQLARASVRERMSILNAVYLPDRRYDAFYPELTPINTFRLVLNDCWDAGLPLLPDRSWHSFPESPYDMVEVGKYLD